MKKYTKEEIFKMDAVEVYKIVLKGETLKRFPAGFWEQPEAKQNAIKCTKYMIEDILKLTDEEIKETLHQRLFIDNKLNGMLQACFGSSPIKAIIETYEEKDFNIWEFKTVPKDYWNVDKGIEATKWLIETKLGLTTDNQIKQELCTELFIKNNFRSMLQTCFDGSPIKAIMKSFPEKCFKPWEFKIQVPSKYWTKKTGVESVKWLIEDKLKLTDSEVKELLNTKLFKDNGLLGMLQTCFNGSPYKAISETYPNKFKKSDFKNYN